jgi:16S rRNA (guanine966-N2)-methyltransferase
VRVIAGRFRGHPLRAPAGARTRPTADRVRQALFAVLGDVSGLRVLDLYAGTGALGIEALSRGAASATFVESWRAARVELTGNLERLGIAASAHVVPLAVERARGELLRRAPFDLVFADPPWAMLDAARAALERVLAGPVLDAAAVIVLEHPTRAPAAALGALAGEPFDQRTYGDTGLSLYRLADGVGSAVAPD